MPKFKFELKAPVTISVSGETGTVNARMEHVNTKNQYQVSYKSADGRATEAWFFESELKATPAAKKTPARKSTAKKTAVKKSARKRISPSVPTVR